MKQRMMIKKIIATILTVVLFVTGIPIASVFAASEEGEDTFWYEVQDAIEETIEAIKDSHSHESAGNWYLARKYDRLPWNFFHNRVQADIVNRYKGLVDKEKTIEYVDKDGKPTGKQGRADLYMNADGYTYIWEVKPYSYSTEPNKSLGELQLNGYVNTDPSKFRIGGSQISGGYIEIPIVVVHTGFTEEVLYQVDYTVESNGLVIYKFKRLAKKKVPNEETVEAPAVVRQPSKSTVVSEVMNPGYVLDDDNGISVKEVVACVAVATAMKELHKKINANPSTNNSLSAAIVLECEAFILTVGAECGKFIFNPQTVNAAEINNAIYEFELAMETYIGDTFAEELMMALEMEDYEKIEEILKEIQEESDEFDKAGKAQPPRDPLVIDLGEEGITLHSISNGVNFDLDNNGFAEKTAWIGTEDGFLAFDRNGNGKIDNGGELFGDQVILSDGLKSTSGFDALADIDENSDGIIDSNDSIFTSLFIWMDVNQNGTSESDELKSLNEWNIVSISLDHTEVSFTDEETGARIAETSNVEINMDGEVKNTAISEFWFPINSSDTTQGDKVTVGNVPDINQAVMNDETGELAELCYQFGEADDIGQKRYYIKQILYFLTGAKDIDINSRGGNIDARDLKVIEEFMGREFEGVGGSNPNSNAAGILNEIYRDIENQYYNILNMYCSLGGYMIVVPEYEDSDGNLVLNLSFLNYLFTSKINNGENIETLVYDLGVYLNSYDEIHSTHLFDNYREYYSSISSSYAEIVELVDSEATYIGTDKGDNFSGSNKSDFVFGEEGDDNLRGGNATDIIYGKTGNDTILGDAGNDRIYGNEGDDFLDGGAGNDILEDNGGNDTYVFTKGYGKDTIMDNGGSNILSFSNLTVNDILVNGTGDYDVTISIKGTNDTLVIKNFRENEVLADYTLVFKDVTMHCTEKESPFKHIYGSDSDDVLKAVLDDSIMNAFGGNDMVIGSKGKDIIYGNSGNDSITAWEEKDVLYGGDGDDFLSGETGDDIIWGEAGCDVLDGGHGNDELFGGLGDDTYIFAKDYGRDIIEDGDGITTVKLGENLTVEDISVYRAGDEAIISIKGTNDMLIISGYAVSSENYSIEIADKKVSVNEIITDGTNAEFDDMKLTVGTDGSDAIFVENIKNMITSGAQYDYIVGGSDEDIVFGGGDTDRILVGTGNEIIYGGEGNDQLFGEDGNDFISGGTGNDYISGGDGDDVIIAAAGDDFVDDSAGNDTYYFNLGDENDSIMDNEGNNTIIFGDGISSDEIKAYRENWNDLLITFEGLPDTLTIKNYCVDEKARNFELIFADGSVFAATDKDSALRNINDKSGAEYMPSIYTDGITLTSTNGDDQLVGSEGADVLIGGDGNNRITGNNGNDSLAGGAGRDYLYGGLGSDTYIYKKGDATDTFSDSQGMNYIEISGYTVSDVKAYRTNWNDITLVLDGSGEAGLYDDSVDKIILEGFYTSEANRQYDISFNGIRYNATSGNSPLRIVYGTMNGDYMQGFDNNNITLYGGEGADTLNGTSAGDWLYGGNGDDRILGFAGKDILNGEAGNDYLEGGADNDTYIFNAGSGIDTVNDNQGVNVIRLGEGLNKEGIIAYRTNWNNLTLTFPEVEDKLVIQGYFTSEDNRKFDIIFADGSKFAYTSLESPINQVYASDNDDWMNAWSDKGISLNGGAGNDNLTGGTGNDVLSGGLGNDTIAGGVGDDSYKFRVGDGFDTITDIEGLNKVIFEEVISTDVTFSYEMNGNKIKLIITLNATGDRIIINDYCADNFMCEFYDGIIGRAKISDLGVSFENEPETLE